MAIVPADRIADSRSRILAALRVAAALPIGLLLIAGSDLPAAAQGHQHLAIYSTEEGGGDLAVSPVTWDFEHQKVQTFPAFCAQGSCIFNTDNPALLASTQDLPDDGLFPLAEGTEVSFEIIALDAAASVMFGSRTLDAPEETAVIGSMTPDFHNHPTWQLFVPEGQVDDYELTFLLTAREGGYGDSPEYRLALTNQEPPPTCSGDCDGNQRVTVDELVRVVGMALEGTDVAQCPGLDTDDDGATSIAELVTAVANALSSCGANNAPTLARIQREIFDVSCAVPFCHNVEAPATNNLSLVDEEKSFNELVGVDPVNAAALQAEYKLVDPGNPDNSFLVLKVEGPPSFEFGSQMPLSGGVLSEAQIQLIRDWIAEGAQR